MKNGLFISKNHWNLEVYPTITLNMAGAKAKRVIKKGGGSRRD